MKKYFVLKNSKFLFVAITFLFNSNILFGGDLPKNKNQTLVHVIEFQANKMYPLGQSMQLLQPNNYSIDFATDSVNSYLPYQGQGEIAVNFPTGSPLNFVKKNVNYQIDTLSGANHYRLTATFVNDKSLQKMILEYYKNGSANLQVFMINYQPISYDGNVILNK